MPETVTVVSCRKRHQGSAFKAVTSSDPKDGVVRVRNAEGTELTFTREEFDVRPAMSPAEILEFMVMSLQAAAIRSRLPQ